MVISIYGGSGSGKTTLATALQQYFLNDGRGCYLLSGDDYPHRIPKCNDEEQLRVYKEAGEDGLRGYLGTKKEIDFARGFSVIDYDLNEQLADREDLDQLKNMGINLKLDFILNHASAQSPQFRDLVEKGEASAYRDFFIDWNHFWEGHGRQYLGQMDVNIQSPKVWEFYRETLEKIASYGAAIVRLDAFAYAPKTPGKKTFSMIRKRGNFYRKSMRWQNLGDLRFCRRSTQRMMKKYMRHLQKKAMQPMTFSCRDWSLMRLRTGGERTLRHGQKFTWTKESVLSGKCHVLQCICNIICKF